MHGTNGKPEPKHDRFNYVVTTGFYIGAPDGKLMKKVTIPCPTRQAAVELAECLACAYVEGLSEHDHRTVWHLPQACVSLPHPRAGSIYVPLNEVTKLSDQLADVALVTA